MPRYARELSSKQTYHVMLRGNNREKIFIDEEDKQRMVDTLREKKEQEEFYLIAYCVMDNHIHIIVKEGKASLARIVKRVGTSYAYYFNKKYRRIGHVFQDRFRSENIEDDSYLLSAIRYVHQNPLKPGIGTIEGYKWSSYGEYIREDSTLVEVDEILEMFSKNRKNALRAFVEFNHETIEETFLDVEEEKEINQMNVGEYVEGFLKPKGIKVEDLKDITNKQFRDELIELLVEKSNLSKRGIALELGLNREVVRKATMPKEPSR